MLTATCPACNTRHRVPSRAPRRKHTTTAALDPFISHALPRTVLTRYADAHLRDAAHSPTSIHDQVHYSRRLANATVLTVLTSPLLLAFPTAAPASVLGPAADRAWEAVGGGPPDLFFPEEFLGVWKTTSVLIKVETPLGEDYVPNQRNVQRAIQEDLQQPLEYKVSFVRSPGGRVIFDRGFNIAMLLRAYYGDSMNLNDRIIWSASNPNILQLSLPNGLVLRTRVTRRSSQQPSGNSLETSEFLEQVFDDGVEGTPARIKASQCFTKYKWRSLQDAAAAGGPPIVATQVVSEYLTPNDDTEKYLRAMNKPVVIYTYRMALQPPSPAAAVLA